MCQSVMLRVLKTEYPVRLKCALTVKMSYAFVFTIDHTR